MLRKNGKWQRGFSLIEIMLVLLIIMILMGISLPSVRSSMDAIRHRNAVTVATTAIQSTRFLAIRDGVRYAVTFSAALPASYQIRRVPPGGAAFVNVGAAVPLGNAQVSMASGRRYEFAPNGMVTVTGGPMDFIVQYGQGSAMRVHTVTVTRVGHVTVQ